MALAIKMEVKESIKDLHQALKKSSSLIQPRIKMLLEIKKSATPLSKIKLAGLVGVDPNSITTWRKQYREHGYASLLTHNQGGKRREAVDAKTHKAIEKRLLSPTNGFTSYKQLQEWVDEHYIKGIKYITLLKYVQTKFGAKLKVARKSHIKKGVEALKAFKKNPSTS